MALDSSEVTISSNTTWSQAGMSKRAGRGLQAAEAMLCQRGFTVHPTDWSPAG